jgi:hypothetical protein
MAAIPALKVYSIMKEKDVKLTDLCLGKAGIIDFWHVNCSRCPAALDKLNKEIPKHFDQENSVFLACALKQGEEDIIDLTEGYA